jgi:hypothetical protein
MKLGCAVLLFVVILCLIQGRGEIRALRVPSENKFVPQLKSLREPAAHQLEDRTEKAPPSVRDEHPELEDMAVHYVSLSEEEIEDDISNVEREIEDEQLIKQINEGTATGAQKEKLANLMLERNALIIAKIQRQMEDLREQIGQNKKR